MDKRTLLITGSSTGFGHATAKLFADRGWNVVATMRDVSAAGDLAGRNNVLVSRLDVTEPASIDQAIKASIGHFGKLDAVINNAGYGQYGIFETIPQESIQRNFDVNVFGVMNVIRAIVPVFRKQKEGLILNVSSVGGLVGLPSISIYLSTKFALEGFTECLSYELASQNIVVKLVEPGGGDTAFHARSSKQNAGDGGIDSYGPFLERAYAALGKLAQHMATPERIAAVIYGAVTDGTKRLRYFAGDDVKHLVEARRKLSDEDYENYMRGQFA
ncbi:NAD(P)-dependent dehydrogenase (short-subunit alcohol dehydrogenase family) [Bradyrhizobium sp. F1.4.3]|uniref:SDR family oxidoreductase n=1 Tax=Bradyrhizobium sp. F1.4.3 TaxID=3156356 RepID=UPI0033975687